jgi:integrase
MRSSTSSDGTARPAANDLAHRGRAGLLFEGARTGETQLRLGQRSGSGRTHKRYLDIVGIQLSAIHETRIGKLTHRDLEALYSELLAEGATPGTVHLAHKVLRAALNDAERWGNISSNPARLARSPQGASREMTVLTEPQVRAFLKACEGHRFEALFVLALASALRQGELLALRWSAIDFGCKTLEVQRSLRWHDGKPLFSNPKTKRSRRTVGLDSETIDVLRAHKARQAQDRLRAGDSWRNGDLVFANILGGPMRACHVFERHYQPLMRKAGLIRRDQQGRVLKCANGKPQALVRFHDLRHTHAAHLLKRRVNPLVVSDRLGHATVAFTLDVYGHLLPGMQETAVEATARTLWA